jgi:hypothetical protein
MLKRIAEDFNRYFRRRWRWRCNGRLGIVYDVEDEKARKCVRISF